MRHIRRSTHGGAGSRIKYEGIVDGEPIEISIAYTGSQHGIGRDCKLSFKYREDFYQYNRLLRALIILVRGGPEEKKFKIRYIPTEDKHLLAQALLGLGEENKNLEKILIERLIKRFEIFFQ